MPLLERAALAWQRAITSLKTRGFTGTMRRSFEHVRELVTPTGWKNKRFDNSHGVDTGGRLARYELRTDSPNVKYVVEYRLTPIRIFLEVLCGLRIEYSRWTFIDIGSGKGRALLLASHFPFARIIGVEFDKAMVGIGIANVGQYRDPEQKCKRIDVVCQDAIQFIFPDNNLVAYT